MSKIEYTSPLVINPSNMHLFEAAAREEDCQYATVELPKIDAGANPFHYDLTSMGVHLNRDYTALFQGGHTGPTHELYLYNHNTGQRISIVAMPKHPVPKGVINISRYQEGTGFCKYLTRLAEGNAMHQPSTFEFMLRQTEVLGTSMVFEEMPAYYVKEGRGILLYPGVLNDIDWLTGNTSNDYLDESTIAELVQELHDTVRGSIIEEYLLGNGVVQTSVSQAGFEDDETQ